MIDELGEAQQGIYDKDTVFICKSSSFKLGGTSRSIGYVYCDVYMYRYCSCSKSPLSSHRLHSQRYTINASHRVLRPNHNLRR